MSKCENGCRLPEDKGYPACKGECFYAEPWPLAGFNAVLAVLEDGKDYCECSAVHTGLEDGGRCEACGKVI